MLLYILGFKEEGIEQFRENQNKFSQWFARAEDNITIQPPAMPGGSPLGRMQAPSREAEGFPTSPD